MSFAKREDTPEFRLWRHLCRWNERGYHFRRASPYGGFMLDFVEHDILLVLEWADEDPHPTPQVARHHVLTARGYTVLRVRRADVESDFATVAETIRRILEDRPPISTSEIGECVGPPNFTQE